MKEVTKAGNRETGVKEMTKETSNKADRITGHSKGHHKTGVAILTSSKATGRRETTKETSKTDHHKTVEKTGISNKAGKVEGRSKTGSSRIGAAIQTNSKGHPKIGIVSKSLMTVQTITTKKVNLKISFQRQAQINA